VVVASPKGGAGKSTASVILATELAHAGAEVIVLDWSRLSRTLPVSPVRSMSAL
jgi:cellulose biosynthesis protein BcsQ